MDEEEEEDAAAAIPTILFMAGDVVVVDSVKEDDVVAAAKSRPLRLPAPRPLPSPQPSQSPPLLFMTGRTTTKKSRQDRKKTIRFARAGFEYGDGVRQAGRQAGWPAVWCLLFARAAPHEQPSGEPVV